MSTSNANNSTYVRPRAGGARLEILQLNVGKSAASHDALYLEAAEVRTGVLLVSELNKRHVQETAGWITSVGWEASIKPLNLKIKNSGQGIGYVWIEARNMIVFSCYCSPNVEVRVFQTMLDGITRQILAGVRGADVIVGGDFNAKNHIVLTCL